MKIITWDKIKQQPISIGTLIVGVVAVFWLYNWLGSTFVTKVEAADYNTQMTAQVAGNTTLLNALTKEVRVSAALDRVDSLDAKLYRMKMAGVNAETLHDKEKELEAANKYGDCLLNDQPDCHLLRD